ncbi:conserved hypothetical protein [Ricinus communis]|uniref:Uncharacterized protein n=1 Tax=Ricinus communis TaxID=3988 RepID=B9SCI2_RICCO|nr:conserved hypothetical protein [Ricinus communis]
MAKQTNLALSNGHNYPSGHANIDTEFESFLDDEEKIVQMSCIIVESKKRQI